MVRRKERSSIQMHQHLLLYLAFFCSLMAVIFSIQTHLSTDFVHLSEPLDVGIFFKNISSVGMSSWMVCALKQDIVAEILDGSIGYQRALYPGRSSTKETPSFAEDRLGMDDDGLVSADFPYRDDDEILNGMSSEFWSCKPIYFNSSSVDDKKWILSRVFFMVGIICGVTATCCLAVFIVSRSSRLGSNVKEAKLMYNHKYKAELSREVRRKELQRRSLDTDSTGYRPIASLFLIAYLFQCVTFIFLDSEICKSHACHVSTGAFSLMVACILWVMSGLLVYLMMRKIWKNQSLLRVHNKKRQKSTSGDKLTGFDASTFEFVDEDLETSSSLSQQNSVSGSIWQLNNTCETELNDTSSFAATVDSAEIQKTASRSINFSSASSLGSPDDVLVTKEIQENNDIENVSSCEEIGAYQDVQYPENGRSIRAVEMLASLR
jgi:hypothetical protein